MFNKYVMIDIVFEDIVVIDNILNVLMEVIALKRVRQKIHMVLETRKIIEDRLNKGYNPTDISRELNRDRSNISREIDKHKTLKKPSSYNGSSICIYRANCKKIKPNCENNCILFKFDICKRLATSPHVCNGCENKHWCRKVKIYYNAEEAQNQYKKELIESRTNLHYTDYELNILNNDFYNLVMINKSIYHSLIVINKRGFNFNIKTIYRQIKYGRLRLKSTDLPRSNRKSKNIEKDKTYKRDITGHTYEDYRKYKNENTELIEWQMDCVEGIQGKGEPVILTLQIVEIKFLFIFKLKLHTAEKVLEKLEEVKSYKDIEKMLNIILTDNGHEFINIEKLLEIVPNTKIFYCHPYSGNEKGSIENNHEFIRRIIPKGVSLKVYDQEDYNLISNNINSLYREELDGKCPFDLIEKYISKETLIKLGYEKIKDEEVRLIPELLGEKNI